jgi:hypothetical protein
MDAHGENLNFPGTTSGGSVIAKQAMDSIFFREIHPEVKLNAGHCCSKKFCHAKALACRV